jgi:hypothetical protein
MEPMEGEDKTMKSKTGALFVLAAVAISASGHAQVAAPLQILPVIAKVSGAAGTDWVTSLSVSNISDLEADVSALFFRENQNNVPLLNPTEVFALEPDKTLSVTDVLGSWYPLQGDTKGFLVLLAGPSDGSDEPILLSAAGRIFNNANPAATYGQTIPSTLLSLAVAPATSVMSGAQWNDAIRTNVGVLNFTLRPLDVFITIYDADGAAVATASKRIRTFSLGQWSLAQLGVEELGTPGLVELSVEPDTITWDPCFTEPDLELEDLGGLFMAYMSRVDQVTGDAEFIQGQTDWLDYIGLCGEPDLMRVQRLPFGRH